MGAMTKKSNVRRKNALNFELGLYNGLCFMNIIFSTELSYQKIVRQLTLDYIKGKQRISSEF